MADDKKNIPEVDTPGETVTPTAEIPIVSEPPAPEPALTDQEAVTLEHEGLAALFETGEAVPDPGERPKPIEPEKTVLPEQPKTEKKQPTPGKDDPAPERSGKVVDFAAARNEAEKTPKEKTGKQKATDKDKSEKPGRGRPPKEGKDKQSSKKSQSKSAVENPVPIKEETPVVTEPPAEPAAPRDASRGEKEEIVCLNLSELHPFKNHPFGVRDDAEMQGLVESSRPAA